MTHIGYDLNKINAELNFAYCEIESTQKALLRERRNLGRAKASLKDALFFVKRLQGIYGKRKDVKI